MDTIECPLDNALSSHYWTTGQMTGQQENIKINSLQERYKLASRQTVYDRMNSLGISPIQKGEISPEQLNLMDRLDVFLRENPNAAIADFPKQPIVEEAVIRRVENFVESDDNHGTITLVLSKVAEIVQGMRSPQSPLAFLRELEQAADGGWILESKVVAELIGVAPHGEVFVRGSFVFKRTGKIGRSAGWRVYKNTIYAEKQ